MQPAQHLFTKAKSRLAEEKKVSVPATSLYKSNQLTNTLLTKRIKYIPILLIGLLGYGILFHIMMNVEPARIANVLFYESYLPLHIVFLISNFFLLSFIFLQTRRAVVWSVFFAVLLFFKLQSVAFTISLLLIVFLFFVLLEALFTFIFKK